LITGMQRLLSKRVLHCGCFVMLKILIECDDVYMEVMLLISFGKVG